MERERTRAVVNTPATRLCTTSLVIETVNRIKFMTMRAVVLMMTMLIVMRLVMVGVVVNSPATRLCVHNATSLFSIM